MRVDATTPVSRAFVLRSTSHGSYGYCMLIKFSIKQIDGVDLSFLTDGPHIVFKVNGCLIDLRIT